MKNKVENPNAFKYMINKTLMQTMAKCIHDVYPAFDQKKFVATSASLDALELKPRVLFIRDQLHKLLPSKFSEAVAILLKSLKSEKLSGFDLWPYTEFIQTYGLDDLNISLKALYQITPLFTSEFAIRPFLKKYPKETIAFLHKCAQDKNSHVRRWASEGSRPRLPWGERLDLFIKDPTHMLPHLELLKYDTEIYVRKSISNHLNDITKDNPEVVTKLLKKWLAEAPKEHTEKIEWIAKQALRSLIKSGDTAALSLMGASQKVQIKIPSLKLNKKTLKMNDRLQLDFQIHSLSNKPQKIVVDYVIHFQKSNGKTAPKVFKLKTFTLEPKQIVEFKKNHHIKPITTRKYYSGTHFVEIQVNGLPYLKSKWSLTTR